MSSVKAIMATKPRSLYRKKIRPASTPFASCLRAGQTLDSLERVGVRRPTAAVLTARDRVDAGLERLCRQHPSRPLSIREIASECGCSTATIARIETLAKARLAEALVKASPGLVAEMFAGTPMFEALKEQQFCGSKRGVA